MDCDEVASARIGVRPIGVDDTPHMIGWCSADGHDTIPVRAYDVGKQFLQSTVA